MGLSRRGYAALCFRVSFFTVTVLMWTRGTGRRIVERHLTRKRKSGSVDAAFHERASCNVSDLLKTLDLQSNLQFIHIPKTGGTTIEDLFQGMNMSVGRFGVTYEVYPLRGCSKWHIPPLVSVKNSFTFVRDPYERLQSEFYWGHDLFEDSQSYPKNDTGFYQWAEYILKRAKFERTIRDCHMIPQHNFAKHAAMIFPMRCMEQVQIYFIQRMKKLHGISHKTVHSNKVEYNANSTPPSALLSSLHEFYADDYRLYRMYF